MDLDIMSKIKACVMSYGRYVFPNIEVKEVATICYKELKFLSNKGNVDEERHLLANITNIILLI